MSIETITICKCDRCGNRMSPDERTDEDDLDVGGAIAPASGGTFQDLCDGCRKSVRNLLNRIYLRKVLESLDAVLVLSQPETAGGDE
jgi:hypothetical protein